METAAVNLVSSGFGFGYAEGLVVMLILLCAFFVWKITSAAEKRVDEMAQRHEAATASFEATIRLQASAIDKYSANLGELTTQVARLSVHLEKIK